jgi:hypothetical protein
MQAMIARLISQELFIISDWLPITLRGVVPDIRDLGTCEWTSGKAHIRGISWFDCVSLDDRLLAATEIIARLIWPYTFIQRASNRPAMRVGIVISIAWANIGTSFELTAWRPSRTWNPKVSSNVALRSNPLFVRKHWHFLSVAEKVPASQPSHIHFEVKGL